MRSPENQAARDIVATLGPATSQPDLWTALADAGATAFRLNTSHLSVADLAGWLERLEVWRLAQRPGFPLILDLQGSKWRLGRLPVMELAEGMLVELVLADESPRQDALPVPHADFFRAAASSSGEIVMNDARVRLELEASGDDWARARVIQPGPLAARKGITFTHSAYRVEALSEKDRSILAQAQGMPGLRCAVSYVRDAAEMARYREFLTGVYAIAKVERASAVTDFATLAGQTDEMWICRGDLGAELGLPGMAGAVHALTPQIGTLPVPVLMAGQVLEHMTEHAAPTRSEICYLYDTLASGYRGVVLSDETAIGKHVLDAVRAAAWFTRPEITGEL